MSEIRKVPATAGAEWLLTGFTLLRRAPLALGSLGMTWGLIAMVAYAASLLAPAVGLAIQFLMALAGPIFLGGMLWAVREVDEGRPARPSHLLHGLQEGRAPHLLMALVPQLVAGLLLGVLLLALIGTGGWQHLTDVTVQINALSQSGAQPDQEQIRALAEQLPAGRILLWLGLVIVTLAAVSLALFVMAPQVMFDHTTGTHALRESLRATLRNLPALLVFFLMAFVALFAIYFAVMLVVLLLALVVGVNAAMFVAQLLLMAVLMPVFAGAVYAAWKQMFAHADAVSPPLAGGRDDIFVA
ncbi:MAG TPA: BPSS1780 family membrane protein [Stenotrophomonas sp.]|jgi:hypothetical protein